MGAIWWILAGGSGAGLLALELWRARRARAAESAGPRLYALYAANNPERPIGLTAVDPASDRAAEAPAASAPTSA